METTIMGTVPRRWEETPSESVLSNLEPCLYLEVHCTYNLLSNCSYNLNIGSITTVTEWVISTMDLQVISSLHQFRSLRLTRETQTQDLRELWSKLLKGGYIGDSAGNYFRAYQDEC